MSGIPGPPERSRVSPWPFVGMIGMACVLFLILAGVLVAPWWVVALLGVVWVVALLVAVAWWSDHPTWVPWLPLALVLLWFATVAGGAAVFDWQA